MTFKSMKTNLWIWERPAAIQSIFTAAKSASYPLAVAQGKAYAKYLYGFFTKGMVRWICDLDELRENGKVVIPDFLGEKGEGKINKWNELSNNLLEYVQKLNLIDFSELTDDELLKLYNEFDDIYLEWWAFTQVAELISYGGEDLLKKKLSPEEFKKHFGLLVTPTKKSYLNKEEEEIFEIVKLAKAEEEKGVKGIDSNNIQIKLKQHANKYYWLHNNYGETKKLDITYFKNIVKEQLDADVDKIKKDNELRLEKVKQDKEELIKNLSFDKTLQEVTWLLDEFCFLQDQRKSIDMKCNWILDNFCREVARRKKIEFDLLSFAVPDQIRDLLSGKIGTTDGLNDLINNLELQKEHTVIIFNEENPEYELYRGEQALKKEKEILGGNANPESQTEIEGMCASVGRYTGKVKILLGSKEADKFNEGDVLVTTMTSPDFVTVMKKAGAIITDEGGITSHAAVVSRELGIPCIIGTKIATRSLKDGDIVEVKAIHGLVHVLERA